MWPIKSKKYIEWLALQLLVLLCWPKESKAYVDPGTGGAILTALMAGVSGFAVILQIIRKRIFGDKGTQQEDQAETDKSDSKPKDS